MTTINMTTLAMTTMTMTVMTMTAMTMTAMTIIGCNLWWQAAQQQQNSCLLSTEQPNDGAYILKATSQSSQKLPISFHFPPN